MSDVLSPGPDVASASMAIARSLAALRDTLADEAPTLAPRLDNLVGYAAATEAGLGSLPCAAIPDIDYDQHPYYRELDIGEAIRDAAVSRFFGTFPGMVAAEQALAVRIAVRGAERPSQGAHHEAAAELDRAGIYRFRLSPPDVSELLERSAPAAAALEARRRTLSPQQRGVGAVLEPLAESAKMDAGFEFYDDLLRRSGVYEIARQGYGCPFRLLNVNLQANTGDDSGIARVCSFPDGRRSPAYYLHVDSAAGVLKVLMYRSEKVTAANGAFRYMPGSHKALGPVERAIRKTIDKAGFERLDEATRTQFMALPPCLRRKANFGNDLLPEAGFDTDALMAQEVAFEGEAGEAVLVDINGAHRGNIHTDRGGRREMFKFVLKAGW